MGGHLGEILGLQGDTVNERYSGTNRPRPFRDGEFACRRCVLVTTLAEMNQEGVELMVCQALADGCEVAFRHLQGKYVVGDMPLVFGIEIVGKPGVQASGRLPTTAVSPCGQRFDLGIALHLAFEVRPPSPWGAIDQSLVNRLLLPVVAVAELLVSDASEGICCK